MEDGCENATHMQSQSPTKLPAVSFPSLSAKALLAAQTKPSPGVDPDKIADKIEARIVAAMPSNAMVHMNEQKPCDVYVPEIGESVKSRRRC